MFDALISLAVAAFLLLGSPGPAPLALAATGATFGVRAGLPFLMGILAGLAMAIVGASLGLNAFFMAFPEAAMVVQLIGAAYIVFIAYKIATAPVLVNQGAVENAVPTLGQGFVLNLLNPKAYAAFFALFTQFLLPAENQMMSYVLTGLSCFVVAVVVDVVWLCLGGVIKPLFAKPKQARFLRVVFAVLMLSSVAWAFIKAKL